MPYISEAERDDLASSLNLDGQFGYLIRTASPGQLNYIITKIVHEYLGDDANYERYNDAIGVLESAKLELYRRKVSPYEDKKVDLNGDV